VPKNMFIFGGKNFLEFNFSKPPIKPVKREVKVYAGFLIFRGR